jgi:hypothetical protein
MNNEHTRLAKPRVIDGPLVTPSSITRMPAGSREIPIAPAKRSIIVLLAVFILTIGLAAVWTLVARRELATSVHADTTGRLEVARRAFETLRARTQSNLQGYCRILVEDPRLKATLSTEGMDAASVADILNDLGVLRGEGFLMVLKPEGRVFAQAGAPELEGLDLSDSSVVKKAQSTMGAAVGSWVLGGKVIDLSIMAIRSDDAIVAYLVVAQAVDEKVLGAVAEQTGVSVASALSTKVLHASTKDPEAHAVFANVASGLGAMKGRVVTANDRRYVTSVVDLAETPQSHRLVLVGSLDDASKNISLLHWMLFAPPILVLIAVLFAMSGTRSRTPA